MVPALLKNCTWGIPYVVVSPLPAIVMVAGGAMTSIGLGAIEKLNQIAMQSKSCVAPAPIVAHVACPPHGPFTSARFQTPGAFPLGTAVKPLESVVWLK